MLLSSKEEYKGLKEDHLIPGQLHWRACLQRDQHPGCNYSAKAMARLAGETGYSLPGSTGIISSQ